MESAQAQASHISFLALMAWTPLPRPDERFRRSIYYIHSSPVTSLLEGLSKYLRSWYNIGSMHMYILRLYMWHRYIIGPRERREMAVLWSFLFHDVFNSVSITSLICVLLCGPDSWLRSVKWAVVITGYHKSYSVNMLIMPFMNTESHSSSISLTGSISIHWIRLRRGFRWMWPSIQINIAVAREIGKPTQDHLQVTCHEGQDQRPSASNLFAARWACVSTLNFGDLHIWWEEWFNFINFIVFFVKYGPFGYWALHTHDITLKSDNIQSTSITYLWEVFQRF